MKCSWCSTTKSSRFVKGLCFSCYQSINKSDGINPIPPKGEVHYSKNKHYPICHICGLAFRKVLYHAYQTHGINEYDYKKKFKLNRSGLTAETTRAILQHHIKMNYEKVVVNNLLNNRKSHENRFKEKLK